MKAYSPILVLAFAAQAFGHAYIYKIDADNTVYPNDIFVDRTMRPAPARIIYGVGNTGPIGPAVSSKYMACNTPASPIPAAIANVRAGANVTFYWSHWLHSHKGPITTWMAPYEGDIAKVNLNELKFFKVKEEIRSADGTWAIDEMMDKRNGSNSFIVPADIKPGKYIVRHELIALHFAISTPPFFSSFAIGPQFYMACLNFNVSGTGTAQPEGVTFPGAYKSTDPAMTYDIFNSTEPFPPLGPPVYQPSTMAVLEDNPRVEISPTNQGAEADAKWFAAQAQRLLIQTQLTTYLDSIGG